MKANELRCKNYVTIYGNETQIVPNDFVKWCNDDWEMRDIKPIPLTEEWLLKFGFEHLPWGWVHSTLKDKAVLISGLLTKDKYWVELGNGLRIDLAYVHTLQNFFALTGNELEIK
jgi:hypothetical protein